MNNSLALFVLQKMNRYDEDVDVDDDDGDDDGRRERYIFVENMLCNNLFDTYNNLRSI